MQGKSTAARALAAGATYAGLQEDLPETRGAEFTGKKPDARAVQHSIRDEKIPVGSGKDIVGLRHTDEMGRATGKRR